MAPDIFLGAFGGHTVNQIILWRQSGGVKKPFSFGDVAQSQLSEEFLLEDLTVNAIDFDTTSLNPVDLIYISIPEPWSIA